MLAYIQKAARKARQTCSSYMECKRATYNLWLTEYKSSKCAKYNTTHQQMSSIEKAEHIINTDWVVQHILVSCDQRCPLFFNAFSSAQSSFKHALHTYITNVRTFLKDVDAPPFIWIPRHPNDGYHPYQFPVYASYIYFCTHLKQYWAHLDNVPAELRPVPILPTNFYTV